MSSIKVTNLQHASAASAAIVLASDSTATAQLSSINGGPLSGARNRIINGDMRIDARNAGAAVTFTTAQYGVDRFVFEKSNLSTLVATLQQVSDGPAGFDKSIKVTVTTAQASGATSTFNGCDQRIEGYNWADMAFGTASAKSFTMSFWVKSSVIGTYPVSFFNADVNRAYLTTYSISVANTWEYKTLVIPGDTAGTWNTTNGIGLGFQMSLGGGSNTEGTAGAWSSTYKTRTSACVNVNATLNATWQITGVQLEAGTVATPFERRSYGQELALAQRYYQLLEGFTGTSYSTSTIAVGAVFRTEMRASPTVSATAAIQITYPGVNDYTQSSANASIVSGRISARGASVACANFSGLTNAIAHVHNVSVNSAAIAFSAEL